MTLLEKSLELPFITCVLITLIHVYLGIHVIERKVIFVDLALAQIAALGAVYGVKMGYNLDEDTTAITLYSLSFTTLGALLFALTRQKYEKVPHEAIIGIIYAVASAATIVLLSKSGMGSEEFKNMLARDLTFVKEPQLIRAGIIFAVVGVFHLIFGKKFMHITLKPEEALKGGAKVGFWDFLFYLSFGLVITQAFSLVGVLMVFTYLVIPATAAVLFAKKLLSRLIIGWTCGIIISYAGIRITYNAPELKIPALEVPTGPFIICLFGLFLVGAGVVKYIRDRENKTRALLRVIIFTLLFALFIAGTIFFQKPPEDLFEDAIHHLFSSLTNERRSSLLKLASAPERKAESVKAIAKLLDDNDAEIRKLAVDTLAKFNAKGYASPIVKLLNDKDDNVRESAIKAVRVLGDGMGVSALLGAVKNEPDQYIATEMAEAVLELGDSSGIPILIGIIESKDTPNEARKEAMEHLKSHLPADVAGKDIAAIKKWWEEQKNSKSQAPSPQ